MDFKCMFILKKIVPILEKNTHPPDILKHRIIHGISKFKHSPLFCYFTTFKPAIHMNGINVHPTHKAIHKKRNDSFVRSL